MTTKDLIKKLEDKNVYKFVWAVWWRSIILVFAVYLAIVALVGAIGLLALGINSL